MISVELTGHTLSYQRHGGVSRYIVELAKNLRGLPEVSVGIQAPIYVNEYLHEVRGELEHAGLYFNSEKRGRRTGKMIAAFSRGLGRLPRMRKSDPDILHDTFFDAFRLNNHRSKRVSTFHDMIHERFDLGRLYGLGDSMTRRKRFAGARSDRLIAVSESTKRDMVEFLAIDPERISVVHLASSLVARMPSDPSVEPPERPFLLWVGARGQYKNFPGFLEALTQSKAWADGINVVCVGGIPFHEGDREPMRSLKLDTDRIFRVLASESELVELYQSAAMLVYVSRYEGFGIPPLEAMSQGCPVVASNASSIPEVVGDSASFCDPSSCESIAVAIDRVFFDEGYRNQLIRLGHQQAAKFSWQRCARETLAVYQTALEQR